MMATTPLMEIVANNLYVDASIQIFAKPLVKTINKNKTIWNFLA